jgi:hypothetical protein
MLADRKIFHTIHHRAILIKSVASFDKLDKIPELTNFRKPLGVCLNLMESCLLDLRGCKLLVST